MRGAIRMVAVGAFWVVCFIVAANVVNRFGREAGFALVLVTLGAAWSGHTDRSRARVGSLMDIAERHYGSAKAAADACGVSVSRWSEWRSGSEQASLPRMLDGLPDAVWDEWRIPSLEGHGFVVAPSGRLASATSAVLRFGAAVEALASSTSPRQEVAKIA